MKLSTIAKRAIEAYGGIDLWQNKTFVEAEVSVKGLAFTLKQRPFFNHVKLKMEIDRPFSVITPIGKLNSISGVLEGDTVKLVDSSGTIIKERQQPRNYFPYGRRLIYWDDLDMAYFANYAFWNYFTLPKLLLNETIEWTEKREGFLVANFPDSIPTHSTMQEFHFDTNTGLLKQHNYTADIISKFAKAAHVVKAHDENNGILFPSRRIVTPKTSSGIVMKHPILIDITVHRFVMK